MPAAPTPGDRPAGRLTDHLDLGVLAATYDRDLIEDVLARTGRKEKRSRALPAHVMVRHAIAQGLYTGEPAEEVMARLAGSLQFTGSWDRQWSIPSTSALAQARARLGPEPLTELFLQACRPLAEPGTKAAWLGDLRLVSLDGTELDTADTPANADHFGRGGNDHHDGAFPKTRLVTLAEDGTRAVIGAAVGPTATGERELAGPALKALEPGMLLLADAGFYSWDLWHRAEASGAHLAWRIGATVELPPIRGLDDGSYTALLFASGLRRVAKDRLIAAARAGEPVDGDRARLVRVAEYTVPERNPGGELVCVATTVMDPREVSAAELAGAYAARWEHESALGEIKTHLRGAGGVLSAKSPPMVVAQVYGLLLAHYAVRSLMWAAADEAGYAPDRMSFTRSVRVVRRNAGGGAAFSP